MFKLTYRYTTNPAKPGTITLIPTVRTYVQAFKPVLLVYGAIGVIYLGVKASEAVADAKLDTENDPEND